jgi:CoA:oxalate CoA-transferase
MKEMLNDISRKGPLRGVVVIDISRVAVGPFCCMLLADLGAAAIKVESSEEPDYGRSWRAIL